MLPLLLAVACTMELDLGVRPEEVEERECQITWAIFESTAREVGAPIEDVVRGYVSGLKCEGRRCDTDRFRTLRALDETGDEPDGWDSSAGPWSRYRERWLRRLTDARAFVDLISEHPQKSSWPRDANPRCRMARHFGGKCAINGACDKVPSCWELAPCGSTANAYWIEHVCSGARTIDAREAAGE